jgi:hypothetical protein
MAYVRLEKNQFVDDATGIVYEWRGTTLGMVAVDVNGAAVVAPEQAAHERNPGTSNQYGASVPECNYTVCAADTNVSDSVPALLFGVTVTVVTAAGVIEIRDATAAAGGTVVLSIPAATPVGTYYPCNGIKLNTGLYCDHTGTGTVRIDWRPQA